MREQDKSNQSLIRKCLVVAGRNLQRAISGDLSPVRKSREKRIIDNLLGNELELFQKMDLMIEQPGEIKVNPDLTTFLDGPDGLGGYADVYAREEYMAPGTKLEMDLERRIIKRHLLSILSSDYLNNLRDTNKPLVIVEGGAGPDLRTFETVCNVLSERKADLGNIPIKIVITDISRRMAAITTSKMRTSALIDPDLNIETAVLAADVFELLEKLSDDSLTYALLPFGVLSFGLDGKDPRQILEIINGKLIQGGGTLTTVYHSDWLNYSNQLKGIVRKLGNNDSEPLHIKDFAPFVIDIKDGKMQVADGLAFNCRTFYPEELVEIIQSAGLTVDQSVCTPTGWAYWPKELLAKVIGGRIYPEGCPMVPPSNLMDLAKQRVLDLVAQKEGGNNQLSQQLSVLIPDGYEVQNFPAPYITITAQKPINN